MCFVLAFLFFSCFVDKRFHWFRFSSLCLVFGLNDLLATNLHVILNSN